MKSFYRLLAAAAIAVVVCFNSPDALAQPLDRGSRNVEPALVKVIKKLKILLGVGSHTDAPVPPRPSPPPDTGTA